MKQLLFVIVLNIYLILGFQCSFAQTPGSESIYGGALSVKSIAGGGVSADVSESLFIGAGTHTINGTWEIYAKNVVLDPGAIISGSGTIIFYNPSFATGAASLTLIDGNAAANNIDANIQLLNASGMQLSNIAFPATLSAAGWINNTTSSSVYVGKDLNLAIDGADIILDSSVVGDLRFDADATISNYRPQRMLITNNSILSHVVKENFTSTFNFPVGIRDGDYTPVQITNASNSTLHVSVQDYQASASVEATADPGPSGIPADGIKRTWHIFGDAVGTGSTINLQHNSSSNQSGFIDASHFVTQWGTVVPNSTGDNTIAFSTSAWQSNFLSSGTIGNISSVGTVAGSSMRSRTYSGIATAGTAPESYFTKSADAIHPLPILLNSFFVQSKDCKAIVHWTSGIEEADFCQYQLQHSTNGVEFKTIAIISPKASNFDYQFTHQTPDEGDNFYKLLMIGYNQKYTSTRVAKAAIECATNNRIKIYPNPVADVIYFDDLGTNTNSVIKLLNLQGQLVLEIHTTKNKESVDIRELPSAPYIVQIIQSNEMRLSVKLTKN